MRQLNYNILICVFITTIIQLTPTHDNDSTGEIGPLDRGYLVEQQTGLQTFATYIHTRPNTKSKEITNRLQSVLAILMLILQSGDVQIQPGPPKYPRGICAKM
jgi:hypothetical protein